ncbi:MAG: hypothetical protein MJZ85_05070 [Bacteroidales bacterium]|nr:hypothetical protein [Bacteroidales bacterium]
MMNIIKPCHLAILLITTLLSDNVFAQSVKKEIANIKNDTAYFHGTGEVAGTYDDARESALLALYGDIARNCDPHAIYLPDNGDRQVEDIVSTFRQRVVEKSAELYAEENDETEEYQCFIYLRRSEFREMCADRKAEIQKYLTRGMEMEEMASFEDALKSYYWALMLCYAHPQGKKLVFKTIEDESVDYEWFVNRIDGHDGILKSFNFIVPKENAIQEDGSGMVVKLKVMTNAGLPVANLRCEYHNGRKYIANTVRDGNMVVNLLDKNVTGFKVKVDYSFAADAKKMNAAVHNAMETIKVPRFSNNIRTIDLEKTMNVKEKNEAPELDAMEKNDIPNPKSYLDKMRMIEQALRDGDLESARGCFSEDGFNMMDTLAGYGHVTVAGRQDYKLLEYNDEVICRSMMLQFDFRNTPGFSQDVVFRFDTVNKVVTSIAFRLSDKAEDDIMSKTKWPEQSRLVLINFLEDYQTAYALKRHRYLESIYSDDALIIVGRVVKKTVIPDRMTFKLTDEEVQMKKYDKDTYLNNLLDCFNSQDYIWLRFTDTDFTKANGSSDVYGVRVRQEYFSSTYGDVGYLFLLVDLRDQLPKIHVRAWQPDAVDLEKLMTLGDVRMN